LRIKWIRRIYFLDEKRQLSANTSTRSFRCNWTSTPRGSRSWKPPFSQNNLRVSLAGTVATDTIDYVATDSTGLTSTSTRTVIIQAADEKPK
jgi:hypothetical protein